MHTIPKRWLQAIYAHSPWLYPLYPLGWVWGKAMQVRRQGYRFWHFFSKNSVPIPVIVVGNFTLGGTGKTPLLQWLVDFLKSQGFSPGIVSRGYPISPADPIPVGSESMAALVGDEPCWLAQKTQVPVIVAKNRAQAVRYLYTHYPVDIILSDDGLSHDAMERSCEIALIDGMRRFGNGQCLPAGPLRAPVRAVSFRVCHGGVPQLGEWAMTTSLGMPYTMRQPRQQQCWESWQGQSVHAIAGIGNPEKFFTMLRAQGLDVISHPFPDHHAYCQKDFAFLTSEMLCLMTEKDAVKCKDLGLSNCWIVPLVVEIDPAFGFQILEHVFS